MERKCTNNKWTFCKFQFIKSFLTSYKDGGTLHLKQSCVSSIYGNGVLRNVKVMNWGYLEYSTDIGLQISNGSLVNQIGGNFLFYSPFADVLILNGTNPGNLENLGNMSLQIGSNYSLRLVKLVLDICDLQEYQMLILVTGEFSVHNLLDW